MIYDFSPLYVKKNKINIQSTISSIITEDCYNTLQNTQTKENQHLAQLVFKSLLMHYKI